LYQLTVPYFDLHNQANTSNKQKQINFVQNI